MILNFSFFGNFQTHFGSQKTIELRSSNLKEALVEFASHFPSGADLLFDGDKNVRRHLIIQVNKKRVLAAQAETVILKENDEIVIYPPVSGG